MTQPVVFIIYSHKDEREKDRLLSHLGVLLREGLVDLWSDDQIDAGDDWKQEINTAMAQARVAILLISANFLTSNFILDKEVPTLLKHRESEGLIIFPVIIRACAWEAIDWLAKLNVRPKNGRPVWGTGSRRVDEDLATIVKEVVSSVVKTDPRITSTASSTYGESKRIDSINRIIVNYQRRLRLLKEQQALLGLNTPPHILIEIEDMEASIERLQTEEMALRTIEIPSLVEISLSDRVLELKKVILRRERELLAIQEKKALVRENIPPQTLIELKNVETELNRLRAELEQIEPQEGAALIFGLALRQFSFTPKIYDRVKELSQSPLLPVRQQVLRAISANYKNLPEKVRDFIPKFANDTEETLRADIATWIIENYDEVGRDYEQVLRYLVQDESIIVRQTIINFGSLELERLPSQIRLLISQLIGTPHIKIDILKGSGMLLGEPGRLVLKVANQNETGSDIVDIEILPSAEYKVLGANPVTIPKLKARETAEVAFDLQMKVAKQVVVNYKVNSEIKEPPLYINVVKDNPYVYGNPIKEETTFFGRQKLLDRIIQAVTKPTKQDILIIGERRTGKTSLIYQLQKRLDQPFVPVYVVLNTSEPSTESVLNLILRKIVQTLMEREILEKEWLQHHYPYSDFIDNVQEVIATAKTNLADIRMVLLLDEADFLLRIRPSSATIRELAPVIEKESLIDERPQNILRAALQSSEIGSDLRAVVAGTTDLSTYVSQRSSPFFNHFRFEPLKPFTVQETHELIVNPASALGYEYTQSTINRITHLSGGQPYYCQALCYEAFESASQAKRIVINDEDAAAAEQKIAEDLFGSYLSGFWERANDTERQILATLAQNKTPKNVTRAQIKRLLDWQLIREAEGKYDFASGLIEKWTAMAAQG